MGRTFNAGRHTGKYELGHPMDQVHSSAQAAARPLRVLVVEHHADTRRQLSRLLRAYALDVRAADSCAAARRAVDGDGRVPDVVVGEIRLPDGDGVELLTELKASHGCPTIAFTSLGMSADVERCRAAGIDRHLLKPLGVLDLREVIVSLAHSA